MKNAILVAALASALTLGTAYAQITKDEYKSRKDTIDAGYKAAKDQCKPLSGNAKDICLADAKGTHEVSLKQLEAEYKPSDKHRYDVRVARAQAAYKVAREKCDDLAGNARDVCVKQAKADETKAKAEAKANKEVREAVADAAGARRDADYQVAKEKCDALAGQPKDNCVADAKARFGK
jgi:hypothetical protein